MMDTKQQRALISELKSEPELSEAFAMPTLAWPTIAILVISFAGFGMSTYALLSGLLSPFITIPMSGFFIFWSFTPLHEAVHRNLSSIGWLNDYVGTFSAQLLLPGFSTSLYRYLHVTHHARTGQDDDPDLMFTEENLLICWVNAAFLDVHWMRYYFSVWSERPKGERGRFTLGLFLYLSMFIIAFSSPYVVDFMLAFLMPMFLGRVLTVHLLGTIQHRKGHEQRVDPIGATSVQNVSSKWWQHLFMLGQSQHLIHHMYPGVPWYKYDPIWRMLKAKTTPEMLRPSGYLVRNHNR